MTVVKIDIISAFLGSTPENLGFVPGPGVYLTVRCTCPEEGKHPLFY